ncbi:class I SAM-dependent methyltransferase [Haladaptatus caseinilyticus]|uniref:class I SAM-dependent methyltransferase n=1 Tax=Haladaptatus caseinilyticus TaxID=2993314 RepID=UPI00224ACF4B|nr:class I SAM-dependent methyltransferase [Haladaptatus caseinilyticus]
MFLDTLLHRTFGRPNGLLGRLGGKLMSRSKGEFAAWVIADLDLEPDDRVLEVGFGPGVGAERLAEAVPDGFVAGIDASPEMVEQARKRNAAAIGDGRVELRYGFADDVPSEDCVFDAAMTMNSMQVWPDAVAGLRELRRVVKPDGTVAVAFTHHSGQSKDELPKLLADAGFDEVRTGDRGDDFCAFAKV